MRASSHDTERSPIAADALLARLGLDGSASDDQVEAAHQEVVAFLLRAPGSLRTWAQHRLAEVDEAYAILRGPDRVEEPAMSDSADLLDMPPAAPARPATRRPGGAPAQQRAVVSGNGRRSRSAMLGDALGGEAWDEPAPAPARARQLPKRGAPLVQGGARMQPASGPARQFSLPVPRALVAAIALVGAVAVAVVGYNLGGGSSVPGLSGTPEPGATGPVIDQAQVAALMTRLATDAEDVEALQSLANLYFGAGDYATAGLWLDKLLAVDPDNVSALLGNGAVAYNVGDLAAAESAWTRAAELDPNNVEVHYDLGFLYLAQEPPDYDLVRAEWQKVIELEPDGTFAQTVAGHLDSLAPSPSGSAAPSAAAEPTPQASAEPTAAASAPAAPTASAGG